MTCDVPAHRPLATIDEVLSFWLEEIGPERWFVVDEAVDRAVRLRLNQAYELAAADGLNAWRSTARGSLALCILLDQVPRNLHRGSPLAFATDGQARNVAADALNQGFDLEVPEEARMFFYLPFEHSENLEHQRLCVRLFEERTTDPKVIDYAHRHLRVIEQFGRFPPRTDAWGRTCTAEEQAFLDDRGTMF